MSFSLTNLLLGLLSSLVGGVLVAIVKSRPALKKIANEREANLLHERAAEMEAMRERIRVLEAERAADRHRINNLSQCLDAILMLIEQDPNKASEAATKIKELRAEQLARETIEKAAIHAARVKGDDR